MIQVTCLFKLLYMCYEMLHFSLITLVTDKFKNFSFHSLDKFQKCHRNNFIFKYLLLENFSIMLNFVLNIFSASQVSAPYSKRKSYQMYYWWRWFCKNMININIQDEIYTIVNSSCNIWCMDFYKLYIYQIRNFYRGTF